MNSQFRPQFAPKNGPPNEQPNQRRSAPGQFRTPMPGTAPEAMDQLTAQEQQYPAHWHPVYQQQPDIADLATGQMPSVQQNTPSHVPLPAPPTQYNSQSNIQASMPPVQYSDQPGTEQPEPVQLPRTLTWLPASLQRFCITLLTHARDQEPEVLPENKVAAAPQHAWSWFSLLTVLNSLGLLTIAYAFTSSRAGGYLDPYLFVGLFLIFLPVTVRLLLPGPSRAERIGLICVVGTSCYLIKIMGSPLYFSFFDEFLHWRTADDILATGHLFGSNMMLPVSPYYPGLEIVTNALSTISGLDTFQSGTIVVGMAHLVMLLAIFLLNEQLLISSRAASIAAILYMANPHFLLFDAQYGYESLALPLTVFVLFTMAPHQMVSVRLRRLQMFSPIVMLTSVNKRELNNDLRWITITAWIILAAIAVIHHVTIFFLGGILLCWTLTYATMRLTPLLQSSLARTTLVALVVAVGSALRPGNPVVYYLTSFMADALQELGHILAAGAGARQLFVSYTGQPTPIWERLIGISSVLIILLGLPIGLICLHQRYRSNALTYTFGIIALCYPLSQAFRFTNSGAELTDRAAAFLFLPISSVLAVFIVQTWPVRKLKKSHITLLTSAILLICMGGIILGAGPASSQLPGPYAVAADSRSIDPQGIAAASWTRTHLGPNNRVEADRINQILMGTYGYQNVVTSIQDKLDVSPVFLSQRLDDYPLWIIRSTKTRYLVVDLRISQQLPALGYYYEATEDGAFHHKVPISRQVLTKFDTIAGVNKVFDSGDILIYDVGALNNATK